MSTAGKKALGDAAVAYFPLSAAWETAIKVASGKLTLGLPVKDWCREIMRRYDLQLLPMDLDDVCAAAALPPLHRDPFDRLLVAVAQNRSLLVLTSDRIIPGYPGIKTMW